MNVNVNVGDDDGVVGGLKFARPLAPNPIHPASSGIMVSRNGGGGTYGSVK